MDNRQEVREFLMSRRAKITPEQAGMPAGTNRRVQGLRRPTAASKPRPVHLPGQNSRRLYPEWDLMADVCVAILRTEAGRDPRDKGLHDLVGELSTRSDEFRTRWASHNVRHHGAGTKNFHHHIVGDLTLAYEGLEMVAEPGLTLTIYTAEPGSASEERLRLLASWAASQEAEPSAHALAEAD